MFRPKLFHLALAVVCVSAANAEIRVTNMVAGETVRYPVVLLEGKAGGPTVKAAVGSEAVETPTLKGAFKVLAHLKRGTNAVVLTSGSERATFKVNYKPETSRYRVNVVFVTASDEEPTFDAAGTESKTYASRLATAVLLMQTFTAESMNRQGFGRRTFNLELDANGSPVVHTVRYPVTGDELRKRDGGRLYNDLYGWIDGRFPTATNKNLVLMGFSRFNPVTRQAEAHTALGGGGLGLFGNTAMWSWPKDLADAQRAFSDATVVDATKLHDDSAYRGTAWGLASTTIGAMLHEMGHTFGLPHTGDPTSIMQRGFDRFNRMFTLVEPPAKGKTNPTEFGPSDIGRWEPRSAAQLACLRWFQPDERRFDDTKPRVSVKDGELIVQAKNGVGAVVFLPSGREVAGDEIHKAFWSEGLKDRPKEKRYKLAEIAKSAGKLKRFRVIVMDGDGNTAETRDSGEFPASS